MPTKHLLQCLFTSLGVVSLLLGAGEIALRAVGFEYPPPGERAEVWSSAEDRAMRQGQSFLEFHAHELWSPKPGARVPWTKDERINAAGYRGPLVDEQAKPGVLRIVTLGSCAAFGRGVTYEDTFSAALERRLRERGVQAEVLNGGVVGTTIQQGVERYRDLFRAHKPDVVISSFCGYKEHESAPRFECDAKRIDEWHRHPGHAPCRHHGWSPRRNLRIVQLPIWVLRVLDGTYWNEHNLDFEERRMRSHAKEYDAAVVRRVSLSEYREALESLERDVRADGGHLMLVDVPNNLSQIKQSPVVQMYGEELYQFSQRERLLHVNGRDVIRQASLGGNSPADLFDADGFPSACSHDLLAQALADQIVAHLSELSR
jgi:hypothetical protein